MIGADSETRGRPREVTDEEILNVIRQAENTEIPTDDILNHETITIGREGLRNRLNNLESQNRVTSRTVGNARWWQLGELETEKVVQKPAIAKAHRWSDLLYANGKMYFYLASGLLFASVVFFIMFLHIQAGQVNPPLLTEQQVLFTGYLFAYSGAAIGILFGIAFATSAILPKATAWWLN